MHFLNLRCSLFFIVLNFLSFIAHAEMRCDRGMTFDKLSLPMQAKILAGETASSVDKKTGTPFHMIFAAKRVRWSPELVFGVLTSFDEHSKRISGVKTSTIERQDGHSFYVSYKISTPIPFVSVQYEVRDQVSKKCDEFLLEIGLTKRINSFAPSYIDGVFRVLPFQGGTLILHCLYALPQLNLMPSVINSQGLARTEETINDFEAWIAEADSNPELKESILKRVASWF